jgi:hypothetical protein
MKTSVRVSLGLLAVAAVTGGGLAAGLYLARKKRKDAWIARTIGFLPNSNKGVYARAFFCPASECTAAGGAFNSPDFAYSLADCHTMLVKGAGSGFKAGKTGLVEMAGPITPEAAALLGLEMGGDGKTFLKISLDASGGAYRLASMTDAAEKSSPSVLIDATGTTSDFNLLGATVVQAADEAGWSKISLKLSRFI